MTARMLFLTGAALLGLSVPAARACNITADVDHAVRMAQSEPQRGVLSTQQRTKTPKLTSTHRVGNPSPSTKPSATGSRYADYPH